MKSSWLGLVGYDQALQMQHQIHDQVIHDQTPVLMGLEHPSTITLGHRADFEKELNYPASHFEKENIMVTKTDRGGMATLHSPGQLVIYPIIPLRKFNLGVRDFLCLIECTTKETLKSLGITAEGDAKSPGLYTDKGKIAFFGFRIDRGVSRHGISINVSNDLNLFQTIKSCGVQNQKLDKISSYTHQNTQEIFNIWNDNLNHNLTT